jgi:hypothetical protein
MSLLLLPLLLLLLPIAGHGESMAGQGYEELAFDPPTIDDVRI